MKKKFINGLLMVAMIFGATSWMVSCKDYDDEKNADLQRLVFDETTKLDQAIKDQKIYFDDLIAKLRSEFETCRDTCKVYQQRYWTLLGEYNAFYSWVHNEFGNYYTKQETFNRTEIISKIEEYLRDYYTKNDVYTKVEVDSLIKALKDELTQNYYTKTEIDSLFTTKLADLKTEILDLVDTKLLNYVTIDSLNSYYTKDEIDDMLGDLLRDRLDPDGDLGNLIEDLINNYLEENEITQTIENIVNNYYTGVDSAKVVEIYNELITTVTQQINNISNVLNEVQTLAKNDSVRIDSLELVTLGLGNDLADLTDRVDAAELRLLSDSLKIVNLTTLYNDLKDQMEKFATKEYVDEQDSILNARIDSINNSLNTRIDSILNTVVPELEGKIEDARDYAEELADSVGNLLKDAITAVNIRIDSLNNAFNDSVRDLRNDLNATNVTLKNLSDAFETYKNENNERVSKLETRVTNLETSISEIRDEISQLQKDLKQLKNDLAKMITGITVNGTYNPVFGTINTPLGVRSNVLIAWHGYIDAGDGSEVMFPTIDLDKKVVAKLGLEADAEIIEAAAESVQTGTILAKDGQDGNAGTIYMTVNPTDQDFSEKIEPILVNSKNVTLDMELSKLHKSDKALKMGWTRADNTTGNGFYEAKATVKNINGNIRLKNFDMANMKKVVADIQNWKDGISATRLATVLYESVNEVLDASAVKVEYTDDATGKARSIVSDYGIAATTVRPLSFTSLSDPKFQYNNQLLKVEDFIDQIINKAENKLQPYIEKLQKKLGNLGNFITNIELEELTPEMIAKFKIEVDGVAFEDIIDDDQYTDSREDFYYDGKNVYVHIEYDMQNEIKTIYGNVEDMVDEVKDKLQDLIDEANDYLADINNLYNKAEDILGIKTIYSYIETLNGHLKRWLTPTKYLQPLMLAETNEGYRRLSQSKKAPSKVKAQDFKLWPTTYNLDMVTPSYKKFVVCTKACAEGSTVNDAAAQKAFNGKDADYLNKVYYGEWKAVQAGIQKGYTYEILYMAMDFYGEIVAKKYYIKGI